MRAEGILAGERISGHRPGSGPAAAGILGRTVNRLLGDEEHFWGSPAFEVVYNSLFGTGVLCRS